MPSDLERRPEWRLAGIIFFGLFALLILWATFRIIWPFLTPLLVAAILVTLTHSLYLRLRDRMRGRSALAAITMLLGITFLLVIPLFLITIALVYEANTVIEGMRSGEARQMLARLLHYGVDGRAAHDETATGTGAFAERKECGITMAHAHLRRMHAQLISDDLRKRGL